MAVNFQGTATGALAGATVGGPVGAAIGAGVGLVTDILGSRDRRKQKREVRRRQHLGLSYNLRALQAQAFEANVQALQARDEAQRASLLGIDLFEASAAASGVSGRSIAAHAATRQIQMGEILNSAARTMESLDAEYDRQRNAALLQAHFAIANGVAEIEALEGNLFDIATNAILTFGAFKKTGVFDKQATVP